MKCVVDSDRIVIKERGCTKMSTDICKSGYMARSENVEFPLNATDVCCRCKEGEACPYCIDELNCTEHELSEFVTEDEQCFETQTQSEPVPEPEPAMEPEPAKEPVSFNALLILSVGAILLVFILILSRR